MKVSIVMLQREFARPRTLAMYDAVVSTVANSKAARLEIARSFCLIVSGWRDWMSFASMAKPSSCMEGSSVKTTRYLRGNLANDLSKEKVVLGLQTRECVGPSKALKNGVLLHCDDPEKKVMKGQ